MLHFRILDLLLKPDKKDKTKQGNVCRFHFVLDFQLDTFVIWIFSYFPSKNSVYAWSCEFHCFCLFWFQPHLLYAAYSVRPVYLEHSFSFVFLAFDIFFNSAKVFDFKIVIQLPLQRALLVSFHSSLCLIESSLCWIFSNRMLRAAHISISIHLKSSCMMQTPLDVCS